MCLSFFGRCEKTVYSTRYGPADFCVSTQAAWTRYNSMADGTRTHTIFQKPNHFSRKSSKEKDPKIEGAARRVMEGIGKGYIRSHSIT